MRFLGGGEQQNAPCQDRLTRMLVLKCLSDETGDDAGDIVTQGFVDVDDREFVNIVNRLVVRDLVARVTAAITRCSPEADHV